MSGQVSGGSQNQSGSQQGTQSGNQTGVNFGATNTDSSGNTTVNTTGGWSDIDQLLRGAISPNQGLSASQQGALNTMTAQNGANRLGGDVDYAGTVMSQYVGDNHPANTAAGGAPVTAQQGADFMSSYQNPFTDQVVNATNADLQNAYNKNINQGKMNAAAGGAFGGGRQGVAEAQTTDDFLRNLGTTDATLRNQGFNTAAGFGTTDANRVLSADTTNAANSQQANQFNANANDVNDARSLSTIQNWLGNRATADQAQAQGAQNIFNMGGSGVDNLFKYLGSQTPAFGQSQTGSQTGTNFGVSANAAEGENASTSNAHGSSKGGGVGAKFI